MNSLPGSSLALQLRSLPEPKRLDIIASLTEAQASELLEDWKFWARPNQIEPSGPWHTWVILAGRGYGKSRTGAETIRAWACGKTPLAAGRYGRIALVAETAADARDVMVEGASGLLSCHPKAFRPLYEPSKRRITWPNGAVATLYNGTEPDQLRGPNHEAAWVDELAKYRYARETWDQLQFGLRLGTHPRQVVTTTPRPIPVLKEILASPGTITTRGSTYENRANLAPSFFTSIIKRFEGTRLGRQELNAEILDDLPGALWNRDMIEAARIKPGDVVPEMERIVVGVDPSGKDEDSEGSDEQGIVVAGLGRDGLGYVLADVSCSELPGEWGRRVIGAYHSWKADRIVAEVNFGGGMVRSTIQTAMKEAPVKVLHVSRGKVARAEPISALYEQRRIRHVGVFPELEDQMCAMKTGGYEGGGSPDRCDAAVFALSELLLGARQTQIGAAIQVGAGPSGIGAARMV